MARTTVLERAVARVAPAPESLVLYRLLRAPVRRVLDRFFDFRVDGVEHLPRRGPVIVAANHHNYLDGVVLAAASPRPIAFLVMPRVWRATPLHPFLHRHIGSIPLNVSRPDLGALRRALAAVRGGPSARHLPRRAVQRERTPRAGPARRGTARAALRGSGRARGDPRHLRRARRPARVRAAPSSAGGTVRAPAAVRSRGRTRGARGRHPADHGRHRRRSYAEDLGRPVHQRRRPHRREVHGVAGVRSPPLAPGHRGQHGVGARARAGRRAHGRGARQHPRRARARAARAGDRDVHLPAGARGHPHERRATADRAHRRRGRQAAHGPLAQRPDRARRAALPARGHRGHARGRARGAAGAGRSGGGEPGRRHARLHPPAARAARAAGASPARVRLHARAGPRAARGLRDPERRDAARRGRARGHRVPDRPRRAGAGPRLPRGERATASTP